MTGLRLTHPSSHYLSLFDSTAVTTLYADEAVVLIDLDGDELFITLPLANEAADADAMGAARSILAQLGELDAQAATFLFSLAGWPYGEDALLWQLKVERDNVRFCYQQTSVNDEQVVGFKRTEGGWEFTGFDPRWRG